VDFVQVPDTDSFSLSFVPTGENFTVVAEDVAGNVTSEQFSLPRIAGESELALLLSYQEKYRVADLTTYSATSVASLEKAYDGLDALFTAGGGAAEVNALTAEIDRLLLGEPVLRYRVDSEPTVVSHFCTFTVADPTKLTGYKAGDTVTLVLSEASAEGAPAVALSGLDPAFAALFRLTVYVGETLTSDISGAGISVRMNLPMGYLERNFSMISLVGEEKLSSECFNNLIAFDITENGVYALVISGSEEKAGEKNEDTPKTISVFGKTLSLGTFIGIIVGVPVGAAAVLLTLTVIRKKRHPKGD
jgi:hypothetical protein